MTGSVWAAAGLSVAPAYEHDRDRRYGLVVRAGRCSALLSPTLARSLRDWLTWYLRDNGDTPPPPDPSRVRAEIDTQRAALTQRSMDVTSEDFRAGLAWADNALEAVARACELELFA